MIRRFAERLITAVEQAQMYSADFDLGASAKCGVFGTRRWSDPGSDTPPSEPYDAWRYA